jgi:hypothetical protein
MVELRPARKMTRSLSTTITWAEETMTMLGKVTSLTRTPWSNSLRRPSEFSTNRDDFSLTRDKNSNYSLPLVLCFFFYSEKKVKIISVVAQYVPVKNWPSSEVNLGQISAVTFDNAGNVVLFQRGDHEWDATTFNATDNYLKIEQGPIKANTLITYDADTGKVVHQWGADL